MRGVVDRRSRIAHIPEAADIAVLLKLVIGYALPFERAGNTETAGTCADDAGLVAAIDDLAGANIRHDIVLKIAWTRQEDIRPSSHPQDGAKRPIAGQGRPELMGDPRPETSAKRAIGASAGNGAWRDAHHSAALASAWSSSRKIADAIAESTS